jgi:hypothetical protein
MGSTEKLTKTEYGESVRRSGRTRYAPYDPVNRPSRHCRHPAQVNAIARGVRLTIRVT